MSPVLRRNRFLLLYLAWIAVCAGLFFGLSGAEDPSRRPDRILSTDAGTRALAILRERDEDKYRAFEAVHVAYARAGEGGADRRWIVLCDRVPHTRLAEAVVVELRAEDGALIAIRKPIH